MKLRLTPGLSSKLLISLPVLSLICASFSLSPLAQAQGVSPSANAEGEAREGASGKSTKEKEDKEDKVESREVVTVRGTRLISEEMYIQSSSSAGNKDDTPLGQTPQSVSVVSQSQLEDQGAKSVQDATRYTAGVIAEPFGFDTRGDYMRIRGSDAGIFRDGMQTIFSANTTQARFPVYGAEKIEILRGPSAMLYGQSPIGGLVNVITKIPRAEEKGEIRYEMGSFNRHETSADIIGLLSDDKTLSYRLVTQLRDSDTFVKHTKENSVYFAPSIRWQPSRDTSLTLLVNYQKDEATPTAQFIPANVAIRDGGQGKIRRETFLGEPGFDEQNNEVRSISILYDQVLSDVWSYHQNMRFMDSINSYQQIFRNWGAEVDPVSGLLDRTSYAYQSDTKSFKIDSHVRAVLANSFVPTTIMFGLDYQNGSIEARSGFGTQPAIQVYKPVYGNYTPLSLADAPDYRQWQAGAYLQADLEVTETTKLILGTRHDQVKTEGSDFDKVDDKRTTSRAALVQELYDFTHAYLSWSQSFTPNNGLNVKDEPLDSRVGEQIEAGVKYQSAEVLAAASYFQTKETNRPSSDFSDPTKFRYQTQGEVEIKGAEFEVGYDLSNGLSGQASYTHLDTEVTKSTTGQAGKKLGQTPERMASLWLNYALQGDLVRGLRLGAGVRHVGESFDGNDTNKVEAYSLYDARVAYAKDRWEFALSGNNLADKSYVSACRTEGDCFYGPSRSLTASTAFQF